MRAINCGVLMLTILFFMFICWIIVQADTGTANYFIDSVRRLPFGDKLGHMWLYGLLAFMLSFVLRKHTKRYYGLPLGCVLVLAFALIEEASQAFFPLRTLDAGDVVADFLGIYLAAWVMTKVPK